MPKKEGKDENSKIIFTRLSSLNDLARYACKFDSTASEVFYEEGSGRLFSFGERVGNTLIAYYIDAPKKADGIRYAYAVQDSGETAELTSEIDTQQLHSYYINVISINMLNFQKAKKIEQKGINYIKVGSVKNLAKMILKKSMEAETIGSSFVFGYGSKIVVGAFDLVEELSDGKKTFYYAIADEKEEDAKKACFIRYNYSTDSLEFTDEFGEHSYMYVKLIHLAEQLPGMKL